MRNIVEKIERDYDFVDVLEAKEIGEPALINEASLGRVYKHVKDADTQSLGIITAWRSGRSTNDNLDANKKLMQDLRSAGFGAFKLDGRWKACPDPGDDECPQETRILHREPSFGVVGISKDRITALARKYGQEAIVYLGPETDGDAVLVFPKGGETKIGKWNPNKIADIYSGVKGGTFVFEGWEYVTQTPTEALIERARLRGR